MNQSVNQLWEEEAAWQRGGQVLEGASHSSNRVQVQPRSLVGGAQRVEWYGIDILFKTNLLECGREKIHVPFERKIMIYESQGPYNIC